MDLADSSQLPRVWPYSGTGREGLSFRIRAYHPLGTHFPERSAEKNLGNSPMSGPTTPPRRVPVVWALPLSLAATNGVAFAFLSWG